MSHGEDAHHWCDLLAPEPVWIAAAVERLVVVQHGVEHLRINPALPKQIIVPARRVKLDRRELVLAELAGLVEDMQRHLGLADVVEQRRRCQLQRGLLAALMVIGKARRRRGHQQAMLEGALVVVAHAREPRVGANLGDSPHDFGAELLDLADSDRRVCFRTARPGSCRS